MLWCFDNRHSRARYSIAWYFFLIGSVLGNWAALIPEVQANHDINNAVLGAIMGGVVLGAILVIPVVTYSIKSYGSSVSTRMGSIVMIAAYPLIGLNGNLIVLIVAMILFGFSAGFQDISMNGQAVLHEKAMKKPSMGFYTCVFACGELSGALIGGLLLGPLYRSAFESTCIFALLLVIPSIIFSFDIYSSEEENAITESSPLLDGLDDECTASDRADCALLTDTGYSSSDAEKKLPSYCDINEDVTTKPRIDYHTLIITCALCFVAYFGEGSVCDWSAIYMSEHGASPLHSTLGIVAFEFFLALGRYYSDYIVIRIGKRKLLTMSGLVAASGLLVAAAASLFSNFNAFLLISIVGFALCGLGLSVVYPTVISIAGSNIRGMPPADAIAYVSSVGYLGIMIGPPTLGGLSYLLGMRVTFVAVAAILLSLSIFPKFIK